MKTIVTFSVSYEFYFESGNKSVDETIQFRLTHNREDAPDKWREVVKKYVDNQSPHDLFNMKIRDVSVFQSNGWESDSDTDYEYDVEFNDIVDDS